MNLLRLIDGFVIDRIAQPLFDRIGDRPTCFDAARFGMGGMVAMGMLSGLSGDDAPDWPMLFSTGIILLFSPFVLMGLDAMERQVRRGLMNPARLDPIRALTGIYFLCLTAVVAPLDAYRIVTVGIDLDAACGLIFLLCGLAWIYGSACTVPPPRRREAVDRGMAISQG